MFLFFQIMFFKWQTCVFFERLSLFGLDKSLFLLGWTLGKTLGSPNVCFLSQHVPRTTPGLGNSGAGQFTGKCPEQLALSLDLSVWFQEEVGGKVWMDRESLFLCLCVCVFVFVWWCLLFVLQNFSFNSNKKVVRTALEMKFLLPIYMQRLDDLNEGFAYSSNLTTTVEDLQCMGLIDVWHVLKLRRWGWTNFLFIETSPWSTIGQIS